MWVSPERRAELHAEALKRILDEAQRQRLETLLTTEEYQEVTTLVMTAYDRGIAQSTLSLGECEMALRQLEAKFGGLPAEMRQRVEALTPKQLRQLALDILTAKSLKESQLQD